MDVKNLFAQQFAEMAQRSNRAQFEIRFNAVQRGLLGQMRDEIQDIDVEGTKRELKTLQKQRDKLYDRADDLRDLRFKLTSNAQRMLDISDVATAGASAANADGNDSLSGDEAEALNIARTKVAEDITRLRSLITNLGISDGGLANRLRHHVETLESLTATTGVIDPEGTDPATNDNRELIDLMSAIGSEAAVYATSASYLVENANQLVIDSEKKAVAIEVDLTELTTLRIAQREEEVAEIETRYGNLIRAISLSFEVSSTFADELSKGLDRAPDKGSILNLFA